MKAVATPVLPETAAGKGVPIEGWTPTALVVTADCAIGMADVPETTTGGGLTTATTGVTGTGLEVIPDIVEEVVELTETDAVDGVSAKETAITAGSLEVVPISDWVSWLTDFSACSRANWKQVIKSENRYTSGEKYWVTIQAVKPSILQALSI